MNAETRTRTAWRTRLIINLDIASCSSSSCSEAHQINPRLRYVAFVVYMYVLCEVKSAHKLNQQRTPLLITFAYIIKINIKSRRIKSEKLSIQMKKHHIILISLLSIERKTYKYKLILPVK